MGIIKELFNWHWHGTVEVTKVSPTEVIPPMPSMNMYESYEHYEERLKPYHAECKAIHERRGF